MLASSAYKATLFNGGDTYIYQSMHQTCSNNAPYISKFTLHYFTTLEDWPSHSKKLKVTVTSSNTQKTIYYFTASKSTFLKFRNFKLVRQRYVAKMLLCQRYQFTVVNSCQQRQHLTLKFTMQIQIMLTQHLQQHANKQVQQRQPPFYCHYKVDLH